MRNVFQYVGKERACNLFLVMKFLSDIVYDLGRVCILLLQSRVYIHYRLETILKLCYALFTAYPPTYGYILAIIYLSKVSYSYTFADHPLP